MAKKLPISAYVVMALAVLMVCLFTISYSLALGRPTPHHIPAALVGRSRSPADTRLVGALESATNGSISFAPARSASAAEAAIEEQQVYAALVLGGPRPVLLLASAAGTSVARVLEQAAAGVAERDGLPLEVHDLNPLPARDPQGLVAFYVTLAATILGFVSMFQLRANAPGLGLREWLGCIAVLGVVGGLVLALVVDPAIGALRGSFFELWAALTAEIAGAALFNSLMLTLLHRWAMIPTWGLFVALGNASSGGAVAPPLLPPFYRAVGRFLPNGATVEIIRNAVYFPSHQHLEPILVEAVWIIGAFVGLLIAVKRVGRTPAAS